MTKVHFKSHTNTTTTTKPRSTDNHTNQQSCKDKSYYCYTYYVNTNNKLHYTQDSITYEEEPSVMDTDKGRSRPDSWDCQGYITRHHQNMDWSKQKSNNGLS